MADDDLVSLLRRAADEKRLAAAGGNDEARFAHRGMADAYEQKLRDADPALLIAAGS
jgi:hypothetical protein